VPSSTYEQLKAGGPIPFIDVHTCHHEADVQEAMFHAILKEQQAPDGPRF
jgi:hypothetical protein